MVSCWKVLLTFNSERIHLKEPKICAVNSPFDMSQWGEVTSVNKDSNDD